MEAFPSSPPVITRRTYHAASETADRYTPRNLLLLKYQEDGNGIKLSTSSDMRLQICRQSLQNIFGADFMVTASGVMWHVHALNVMRCSKTVLNQLHPRGALVPTKFKSLDLHFHPQVVDQFVYYCYLADYQFDQDNEAPEINFATSFPPDRNINSFPYRKSTVDFHLEMYELAEHVESEFLKETVHQKLSVVVLARQKYTALELGMFVEIFFAAVDAARLEDDDRRIGNIFVTAVLLNERVRWNRDDSRGFWAMIGEYRGQFVEAYKEAEKANRDLLGSRR